MQEVDILVSGKPVKKLAHDGKIFIVAKPGTQYEVRVKNNSTSRIMAVGSIDGLNVISGKPAEQDSPGYVIEGYNSYTIKGWRTSNDEVSPFEFSKKDKSYAVKSEDGDPRNCGVIGIAIHSEKIKKPKVTTTTVYVDRTYPVYREPYIYPYRVSPYWSNPTYFGTGTYLGYPASSYTMTSSQSGGSSNCMAMNCSVINTNSGILRSSSLQCSTPVSAPEFDMGTKFSEESLEDKVTDTKFKSSHIIQTVEIYYASEAQLRAMGVPVDKETKVALPQAFGGFCRPPVK